MRTSHSLHLAKQLLERKFKKSEKPVVIVGEIGIIVGESGAKMFYGQKELVIDDKKRLVLPAVYRDSFSGNICCITLGMDNCIYLYEKQVFDEESRKMNSLSNFSAEARRVKRIFSANSRELPIDGSRRILLPKEILVKVGIDKNCILIGMFDHLELWDLETYKTKEEVNEKEYEILAEKMLGVKDGI